MTEVLLAALISFAGIVNYNATSSGGGTCTESSGSYTVGECDGSGGSLHPCVDETDPGLSFNYGVGGGASSGTGRVQVFGPDLGTRIYPVTSDWVTCAFVTLHDNADYADDAYYWGQRGSPGAERDFWLWFDGGRSGTCTGGSNDTLACDTDTTGGPGADGCPGGVCDSTNGMGIGQESTNKVNATSGTYFANGTEAVVCVSGNFVATNDFLGEWWVISDSSDCSAVDASGTFADTSFGSYDGNGSVTIGARDDGQNALDGDMRHVFLISGVEWESITATTAEDYVESFCSNPATFASGYVTDGSATLKTSSCPTDGCAVAPAGYWPLPATDALYNCFGDGTNTMDDGSIEGTSGEVTNAS